MIGEESIKAIQERIKQYPLPREDATWGEEYQFPKLSGLSGEELSIWLSKLADWEGYAMRLLLNVEIEVGILEDSLEAIMAKATYKCWGDKRPTKDYILGKTLTEDQEAINAKTQLINKKAEMAALKRLTEMYNLQLNAVSREISRRQVENQRGLYS